MCTTGATSEPTARVCWPRHTARTSLLDSDSRRSFVTTTVPAVVSGCFSSQACSCCAVSPAVVLIGSHLPPGAVGLGRDACEVVSEAMSAQRMDGDNAPACDLLLVGVQRLLEGGQQRSSGQAENYPR